MKYFVIGRQKRPSVGRSVVRSRVGSVDQRGRSTLQSPLSRFSDAQPQRPTTTKIHFAAPWQRGGGGPCVCGGDHPCRLDSLTTRVTTNRRELTFRRPATDLNALTVTSAACNCTVSYRRGRAALSPRWRDDCHVG